MGDEATIPIEELEHYADKARRIFGRDDLGAQAYERLAKDAAEDERFYAASTYYKLAEAAAADDAEEALRYARMSVSMMARRANSGPSSSS